MAPLSEADRVLLGHAVSLTTEQRSVSRADLDRLRSHGFDDVAIHDATQVVGYFNYVTRIADGLGIDPEDFIHPWGGDG
jgi:alkylhydroperoxidase family enzyme